MLAVKKALGAFKGRVEIVQKVKELSKNILYNSRSRFEPVKIAPLVVQIFFTIFTIKFSFTIILVLICSTLKSDISFAFLKIARNRVNCPRISDLLRLVPSRLLPR